MRAASLSLKDATALASSVLTTAGTDVAPAFATAAALVAAEADGIGSHGLSRLPGYADQVRSGKVDGRAVPVLEWTGQGSLRVDASSGFAFPAIARGLDAAASRIGQAGVVAVAIRNSHHAGVMGHHVELLAERGLVGLAFSNSPAAMAPWGGHSPIFGTNPIAFAVPRWRHAPLVIDASLSVVARGRVVQAASRGEMIPEGWALDAEGRATTDPGAALEGTMLPIGDAKGAAFVLMVEVLAAALTGGQFGFEASSFFTAEGPAPRVGQLFLVLDPRRLGGPGFLGRLEILLEAVLAQPGTRLPGDRRLAAREQARRDGIRIEETLLADLRRRAGRA